MKNKIINKLWEYHRFLTDKGYDVLYIGLYGSQNYNLHDINSDIDVRAIVMPTLKDLIFRKNISVVYEVENSGAIDVKDLITYYSVIKKGNLAFIEPMHTDYWIGDEYIRELFKNISANPMAVLGTMFEKQKVLTHEYPSKKDEFEKFGFDPKQLHHIIRLYDILWHNYDTYKNGAIKDSFINYQEEITRQYMLRVKRNNGNCIISKEEAIEITDHYIEKAKELINNHFTNKYEPISIENEIADYVESKILYSEINK